jgi:carbamoyl-phosphate synthase large subunit
VKYKVPHITTLAAAMAAVKGIEAYRNDCGLVKSLQAYHMDIEGSSGKIGG